jgi:inhibitor of cysteine peptidase
MKEKHVQLSGFMLVGILIITGFLYAVNVQPIVTGDQNVKYYGIKNFTSYRELTEFIAGGFEHSDWYATGWDSVAPRFAMAEEAMMLNSKDADGGGEVVDYSQTNVQVAGVDEPDIVKTDGTYLYIVSGNKVIIVKATPAENATIEAEITVNESTTIYNIFISRNRLVIFAADYNQPIFKSLAVVDDVRIPSPWYSSPDTYIKLYDIADLQHPELIRDIVVGGSFSGARLIDDYIYVITTQYSYQYLLPEEGEAIVPRIQVNGEVIDIPLSDIHYVDLPEKSSTVTNIVSMNIHDDESKVNTEVFLLGDSHVLYVSRENIYVTYSTRYYDYEMLQEIIDEILMPVLPESITSELEVVDTLTLDDYQKQTVTEWILQNYVESMDEKQLADISRAILRRVERTVIHRIHIHDGDITYETQGNVPGGVSNQFSLSEHNGYLRISTTMQGWMVRSFVSSIESQNNIYVLDMDLEIVGSLEGLAPGEQIYATRFIGDTCYLVTFRQIDPFFVIDLSDPTDPTVLGELKIPGFSTYLHPYDETHVIGIGREDNKVKISLFDVSDMSNPVELAKYEIENNDEDWHWMQSSALYEHKAFLFDREKNLLVIPVGDYSKQSAYVFDISVEDGIELKGTVTHDLDTEDEQEDIYYWGDYGNSIQRTLYIGDILYTISNNMVKMNDLKDLSEINSLELV